MKPAFFPALTRAACWLLFALGPITASANPYPDPEAVPKDLPAKIPRAFMQVITPEQLAAESHAVLRVHVRWNPVDDSWQMHTIETENSGTPALLAASRTDDPHGSYRATLTVSGADGTQTFYSTIGTGSAFRKLTRILTFRFPLPEQESTFTLTAENPETGAAEIVLEEVIEPVRFRGGIPRTDPEVRLLRAAIISPSLVVNVYAEGYLEGRKEAFFQDAARIPATLVQYNFPMLEHLEFRAVWAPSAERLGTARDLGQPVPVRDSFLGLYFPYWYNFGRYYHVVYPTSEIKYRRALGTVPYDYPIALVDDSQYWGVGNFKELTAIPSRNSSFAYLLLHEFGHFFGLNEEYEGGGPTELAFAPGTEEPWSQNITFQSTREDIKWQHAIAAGVPLPTPRSTWQSGRYGAYAGGYADTPKPGSVFKPGFGCTMESGRSFCRVCDEAIRHRLRTDLGIPTSANKN